MLRITTSESKLKTFSKVVVACQCGTERTIEYRAWKQSRDKRGLPLDPELDDPCQSCIVIKQHADGRGSDMTKARSATQNAVMCNVEFKKCPVCSSLFTYSITYKRWKRCEKCRDNGMGKNWFSKLSEEEKNRRKTIMSGQRSGAKNPRYGKTALHPKPCKVIIDGVSYGFRSRWEAAYAISLSKIKQPFEYESATFDLGGKTYTPDFYTNGLWVEVKGFWRDKGSFDKFESFKTKHPNAIIVDCAVLTDILGFNPKNKRRLLAYLNDYLT